MTSCFLYGDDAVKGDAACMGVGWQGTIYKTCQGRQYEN